MLETTALLKANGRWPEDLAIWQVTMPLPYESHAAQARVAASYACLDVVERCRADRYRVIGERTRYVITRAILRQVLSERTGVSASALQFTSVRNGRPALVDHPELSFNVSHAGDHALIAVSEHREVGIDIEPIDPSTDWQSLVDMVCSASQREQLHLAAESSVSEAAPTQAAARAMRRFFQCWTAKEAILKALGLGLIDALGSIDFDLNNEGMQRPRMDRLVEAVGDLSFHWISDIDGYMGCIAYSDPAA